MKAREAKDILKAVKKWLKQEVKQVTDTTDNTEEFCVGRCVGRHECAVCLLDYIKDLEDLHDAKRAQKIDDDSWRA